MAIAILGHRDLEGFLKKIKKAHKKIAKKVVKVVKSPIFLKLASVGALFIPGAGPLVSAALIQTSRMVEARQAQKEEIKAQKRAVGMQEDATVAAVAYAQATAIASGSPEAQQNVSSLVQALTGAQQQQVQAITPEMTQQIREAGAGQVFESSIKGFGQAIAANRLSEGAGVETVPEMSELDRLAQDNPVLAAAIKQGMDDLLNSAALTGDSATFETAMNRGTPSIFPWTPVLIGVGAIALTGVIYIATA